MRHGFVIALLVILVGIGAVAQVPAAAEDLFANGRAAFEAGQFSAAAKSLRAAAVRQPAAGTLRNLGLAEWRRGRAGLAIVAWEQALWLDPRDQAARENLAYARKFVGVEAPEFTWYERASTWLPVNAWAWIAGGSLWLAIAMAVLPGALRWRRASWQQALAAVSLAVFFLSLPAHLGVVTRTRIGFVVKKDTPLRLTPTAEAEATVKLNAGQPMRVVRTRGDYLFVRTAHGEGWVEKSQFGSICQN